MLLNKLGQIQLQKTVTVKVQCNLNDEIVVKNFKLIMDCLRDLDSNQNDLLSKFSNISDRLSNIQKNGSHKQGDRQHTAQQISDKNSQPLASASQLKSQDRQSLLKLIKQLDGRTSKNEKNILDNIKDINLINKQLADLRDLISKLNGNNNNNNNVTENLGRDNSDLNNQSFNNINKQVQNNKQLILKTNQQLEKLRKQLEAMKDKTQKLLDSHDKRIKILQDSSNKNGSIGATNSANNDSQGLNRAQFNQLRQKVAILNKKTNGLELMSDELKNQCNGLGEGQSALENTCNNLNNQIQKLKDLISSVGPTGGDNKNDNSSNQNKKLDLDQLKKLRNQLKNQIKQLRIQIEQLKRDNGDNSKTSIDDQRRNKAALTQARFKDDNSLKDLIARVQFLEKMMGGSKNSIDDKNGDKLPLIKRNKVRQRDQSFNDKSSSKRDVSQIKAEIQAWLNNYLAEQKDKDNLQNIQLKLQQLKNGLNRKADQEGLKKGLSFLQNKINHLYLFLTEPDGDQAMIVRKGFNCLSCSKKVQKLRGKIGPHINWNNMTATNYSPPKVGYSRHVPEGSGQKQEDQQ